MAPTREKSIHNKDGSLEMSRLNSKPNPAQYRATIAIVYKEDRQLNEHFMNLGTMQVAV